MPLCEVISPLPSGPGSCLKQPPGSVLKKSELAQSISDKARKVTVRGSEVIVPLKFDEDGEIVSEATPPDRLVLKRLKLLDLRFLKEWRAANWSIEEAIKKTGVSEDVAKRLIKKLSCFRDEDAKVKALAEIPTPSWIAAKHVENIYDGGTLEDSQQKSLQELAKIEGAYKPTQSVSVNISLEKPAWTPEQEQKLREVYDTFALEAPPHAA